MKIYRFLFYILINFWIATGLWAQPYQLKGQVQNAKGISIPYALVHVSGQSAPIYADSLGFFEWESQTQNHTLRISYPDFVPKSIVLPYNYKETLIIYLDSISGTSYFNPYELVRLANLKAQDNRKNYTQYKAVAFKTNKAKIIKVPNFTVPFSRLMLPGKKDTGLVFFSEQLSHQLFFNKHHFDDSITHFRASGTLPLPDLTYLADKDFSLYHELISMPELGYSTYISPLADDASALYDFKSVGSYFDGNRQVYRISFSPKKYGTPALNGYMDIYDSVYTLAYGKYQLRASSHLESVDSVLIEQFYNYHNNNYSKAFQKMEFHLSINGYEGLYTSEVYYKQHSFLSTAEPKSKDHEVLSLDSTTVLDDSSFWEGQRITALSPVEKNSVTHKNLNNYFREKYSRVPHLQKSFKPISLFYRPHIFQSDEYYFYFKPAYQAFGYNTVEGVYFRYNLPIKVYRKHTELKLEPEVRFGFSDLDFKSRLTAEFIYDLGNPKKVQVELGHVVDQFNPENPISPLINSIYGLHLSRNYLKLYGKDYFKAGYQLELINGLEMQSSIEYASRFPLYNTSTFVLTGTSQGFTPNNPNISEDINNQGFEDHQALTFRVQLAYRFHQRYETINGKKVNLRMNTPRIYLNYRQGIESSISQTRYSFLAGGMTFNTPLGNAGFTKWDLSAGGFFDVKRIEFVDYKHFNGTQTFYLQPSTYYYHPIKQFSTLGYYDLSTKKAFVEAHAEHHFNGFLLSKVKLLRKTQAHTYLGINYLHNFTANQFYEFFIGMDNIHNIMRMEFAIGLDNTGKFYPTFLVGIDFDLLYYAKNRKK